MSTSLVQLIAELTVAASIAILIVAALRRPLRRFGGSRVAYLCWLLVPISQVAVLLPAPSQPFEATALAIPQWMSSALPAVTASDQSAVVVSYATIAVSAWASGSLLMLLLTIRRQRAFTRTLGVLTAMPDGTERSSTAGPLLIGVWRPRVVLPANFEELYDSEERALILAHERAHRDRGDQLVNMVAAIWLCLAWFNPLMYWAMTRLRFDQDLTCDAVVLARRPASRRRYASALLKGQLATESRWSAPVACSWQSSHPLTERIAVLKLPLPTLTRRSSAILLLCALMAYSGYVAWVALPRAAYAQATPANGAVLNEAIKALNADGFEEARKLIATIDLNSATPLERGYIESVLFNIALHDKRFDDARGHLERAANNLPPEQAAISRYQGEQALRAAEGK